MLAIHVRIMGFEVGLRDSCVTHTGTKANGILSGMPMNE